jgi:nucleotide-binding universal stress UspA family protein
MQLTRILVAVDFSEPARMAFDQALALSRGHGAELTLVHAVPLTERFRWRGRDRVALVATLRKLAASAGVKFKVSIQQGDPADIILLHAGSRHPDLIVLGTHQRTGIDRLRTGSVAERVAAVATQPVLIVPVVGAAAAPRSFDSIVVAVDFGAASTRAIETGLALAAAENGRLTVVHVMPESSSVAPDAWRRVQELVPPAAKRTRTHARVSIGDPPTEIARIAAEVAADLIVVGVTRRGALSRLVYGATAARVSRVAAQQVLAVPQSLAA